MPPALATAEKEILTYLKTQQSPASVPDIVTGVRKKKASLRERDIRPSFWLLAASGKIIVDSSFRASVAPKKNK